MSYWEKKLNIDKLKNKGSSNKYNFLVNYRPIWNAKDLYNVQGEM